MNKLIVILSKNSNALYRYISANTSSDAFVYPENGLHPTEVKERFTNRIPNVLSYMDVVIVTNSQQLLNTICEFAEGGVIDNNAITIKIISSDDDDELLISESGVDSSGDLADWPVGFFCANGHN